MQFETFFFYFGISPLIPELQCKNCDCPSEKTMMSFFPRHLAFGRGITCGQPKADETSIYQRMWTRRLMQVLLSTTTTTTRSSRNTEQRSVNKQQHMINLDIQAVSSTDAAFYIYDSFIEFISSVVASKSAFLTARFCFFNARLSERFASPSGNVCKS